jgi:hypothetical protein
VDYFDFAMRIEPLSGDAYPVLVRSPAGEGRGGLPRAVTAVTRQWHERPSLCQTRETEKDDRKRDLIPEPGLSPLALDIGEALFDALVSPPLRALFERSMGLLGGNPGSGLRLRLEIDLNLPELAAIHSLPWELLYSRAAKEFLCLNRHTALVRSLLVARPLAPLDFGREIRIQTGIASPRGYAALNVARELRLMQAALAGQRRLRLLPPLLDVTPEMLRRRLAECRADVFHFIGHGCFDTLTGEGSLAFMDERGDALLVPARALARLLGDHGSIRLVVANACRTASSAQSDPADPFAGVAAALLAAGLSAVVGMQRPISDLASAQFSGEFYRALAAGESAEEAISRARLAIYVSNPEAYEWATPVLFLHAPTGALTREGEALATFNQKNQRIRGHQFNAAQDMNVRISPDPEPAASHRRRGKGKVRPAASRSATSGADSPGGKEGSQ